MNSFQTITDADLPDLIPQIRNAGLPLRTPADLDPVLERIGRARYVLIGEASHGTSEFYVWRAALSRRLIEEQGFSFVAVEGDWPDCYRINRYLKGYAAAGENAHEVLHAFERWPTWMWANWEVAAFCEWLRHFNRERRPVGFYGLDVYSLWESMEAILDYLKERDPQAVEIARRAYFCFEPYAGDAYTYARSTAFVEEDCEAEVVALLGELRRRPPRFDDDPEASFDADQNALIAVNGERYYRAMLRGDIDSWNVRDHHMMETLDRLMDFHGPAARGIVWAHNTHIGDARATDMASAGMVNLGQLAREQHPGEGVVLVGFGSHHGAVIAGPEWDAPMQAMRVPPAPAGSWEDVLHRGSPGNQALLLDEAEERPVWLKPRGHRAIGVVYDPAHEAGNYVPTILPQRYDVFLFIDETTALHPLHGIPRRKNEPPETFPWGF